MVWTFTLDIYTLTGLTIGWLFFFFMIMIMIMIISGTPVLVFLKAKFLKYPLFLIKMRDGSGRLRTGKQPLPGTAEIKGLGPVQMTEGSFVREEKSGLPLYSLFAESAATVPDEYPALIEELRQRNFRIDSFTDYERILTLVKDKTARADYIKKLPAERVDEFKIRIEQLEKMNLDIKPYKSYKMHELANLFPFNMKPSWTESYATYKVNAALKKAQIDKNMWIIGAIVVFILVLSAVVAYKFLGGDGQTVDVVCQWAGPMADNVSNMTRIVTSNLTV